MAEVTGAHSSELINHHMTNITRSQFTKLNLNLKKLIIIIKPTMRMSLRKGEAALEKTATNNKSVLILNFWFLVLHMQASIAYKSLINTCTYTAYSKSWPAASEDLINKPPTNIEILNFIASTWAKSFLIPQVWKPATCSFAIKLGGMSDFFFNRTCKAQFSLAVTKYWQLLRTHTSSASSCKQTNGNKSRTAS